MIEDRRGHRAAQPPAMAPTHEKGLLAPDDGLGQRVVGREVLTAGEEASGLAPLGRLNQWRRGA